MLTVVFLLSFLSLLLLLSLSLLLLLLCCGCCGGDYMPCGSPSQTTSLVVSLNGFCMNPTTCRLLSNCTTYYGNLLFKSSGNNFRPTHLNLCLRQVYYLLINFAQSLMSPPDPECRPTMAGIDQR